MVPVLDLPELYTTKKGIFKYNVLPRCCSLVFDRSIHAGCADYSNDKGFHAPVTALTVSNKWASFTQLDSCTPPPWLATANDAPSRPSRNMSTKAVLAPLLNSSNLGKH